MVHCQTITRLAVVSSPQRPSPFTVGVLLLVVGAVSVQLGAAIGTSVIPAIGVLGIVLARYLVQAAVHVPVAWRQLRRTSASDWRWGLLVAVPLLSMNGSIYMAFSHIGVGLSVTIELLGPIALAAVTARTWPGWVGAGLALVGMVLVTGPTGSATGPGVVWAVVAAVSWALYLVAVRVAGQRLPGLVPSAMASLIGLAVLVPSNLLFNADARLTWTVFALAFTAGLLSSALPYAFDMIALRRLPMNVASTMMSLNPVMAVMWGAIILGERLGLSESVGLVIIATANVLVVRAAARARARARAAVATATSG
ncbi:inner membrane transporter RhtA [Tessaracoccus oleiagri]|uniref:Inner membrane transporter RhtA n=1 Tax=Tessaracoccus oleiagri TaxID=686624 RepID=A0A1G9HGR1_9ACTN|nr:inner membrane transporter RhtA [Tessaracoccus oleiagri]